MNAFDPTAALSSGEPNTVAARLATLDHDCPQKEANGHDFSVKRDDAERLFHDSHQPAQICAPSLAARRATADRGRPQENAPIGAFSQEQVAQLLHVSRRSVQNVRALIDHGTSERDRPVEGDLLCTVRRASWSSSKPNDASGRVLTISAAPASAATSMLSPLSSAALGATTILRSE